MPNEKKLFAGIGILVLVLVIVVVSYSNSIPQYKYFGSTYMDTEVAPEIPNEASLVQLACDSAADDLKGAITELTKYNKKPSSHKAVAKKLSDYGGSMDATWKTLEPGEVYWSILSLSNSVMYLADSVAQNNQETFSVFVDQFISDGENFFAACK
jgi:hypothetical protein